MNLRNPMRSASGHDGRTGVEVEKLLERRSVPGSMMPGPIRIIAGSGRSGTTWVQDVLADANALRPIFEPLHPLAVPQADPFAYRYLRPAVEQAAAAAFLTRVFEG